ncbi:site-specific DNA-methyltransferase [Myxococcota bacterium]|nr:site-specific DNA-methyltransferase [Myxococcota bacterium]
MLDHLCRVADILSIEISREKKTDAITAILQALRDRREGRLDHQTRLGQYFFGDSSSILQKKLGKDIEGKVNLILTSPPFPLNKKKKYGNLRGDEYREWLVSLAPLFARLLAPNGSIVIELGNAWEPGRPVQSLLHLHSLIEFVENPEADLRLCQQFVCYNPARLPGPTQWVTVERSRLTDSFTQVWWMAKSDRPKADNRRVLRPYSDSMTSLLKRGQYNSGSRPSGHDISAKGFLKNHGGSIMPNVLELTPSDDEQELLRVPENILRFSNTHSNDEYHRRCQIEGITPHPARMPASLAAFFVEFLTEPGDLVLDPFGGSNTTGYVAELLHRRWIAVEADQQYARQSQLRFPEDTLVIHGE